MATIITTTGISIIYNTRNKYSIPREVSPTDDQIRQFLRQEPEKASAEVNSLRQIATVNDYIVLLHTEDPEAARSVQLLAEFLKHDGYQHVRVVPLKFQAEEQHIETHGLRHLVNTLIEEIEKAQKNGQEIIINATAGLKAQIVYSTMIGMLYDVPVKYIYETFRKIVTFVPMALSWDTNLFINYEWFFRWFDGMKPRRDIEKRLETVDILDREQIRSMLTLPDKDEDIFLLPMVEALWQMYINDVKEAQKIPMPPNAQETDYIKKINNSVLDDKHHPPKGTKDICKHIARLPFVEGVIGSHYENTTNTRITGYNGEEGTIWLLWADTEKAVKLIVQTTARNRAQTYKAMNEIREILEKRKN